MIPTLQSLKKFIPADHLWPVDDYWNYHAGLERFTTIGKFVNGMEQRYGKAANLEQLALPQPEAIIKAAKGVCYRR